MLILVHKKEVFCATNEGNIENTACSNSFYIIYIYSHLLANCVGILFSRCPSVCPKCTWFPINNLSFNDPILLKLIRYLTFNNIHVEFEREGYSPIWPVVMASDRREKCKVLVSAQELKFK